MLIDIGANLTAGAFRDDVDGVLRRARAAGVAVMIVTGTDVEHSVAAAELARDHPGMLYATAGVHPHHADGWGPESAEALRRLSGRAGVVALGECGLDFNRNYSSPAAQERCFEEQLALAAELRRPVFLHQRDAHARFTEILAGYRRQLPGAVAHCFTGGPDEAAVYVEMGLYIGITGWICDERRGAALREAIKTIPLDRLLLETDAPYLLPRTLVPRPASRRNEPMYLPHIRDFAAACAGVDSAALEAATTANARRLFGLPDA